MRMAGSTMSLKIALATLVGSIFGNLVGVIQTLPLQRCEIASYLVTPQNALSERISGQETETSHGKVLTPTEEDDQYEASNLEAFVFANASSFGLHEILELPSSCRILNEELQGGEAISAYTEALSSFAARQAMFPITPDVRLRMRTETKASVCQSLRLHPEGVAALFPNSSLSYHPSKGFMEPLIPPLRHPNFCHNSSFVLDLDYLVHDFSQFCQSVKQTSRFVFIDMGASLDFHEGLTSPVVYLTAIYEQFGFPFDHIYAFEVTLKNPMEVFEKVPAHLLSSYHWINRPVSADPSSRHNPLNSILSKFDKDDFIVIKLDIDTPGLEISFAEQLLNNATLYSKVDVFYFEHHVRIKELLRYWRNNTLGSMKESLNLFQTLRKRGIAAHSWV